MVSRHVSDASIGELRARVDRLANAAADIQDRIESRSKRLATAVDGAHDPVQDRLFWVLARLDAQRQAAARQLALTSSKAAFADH